MRAKTMIKYLLFICIVLFFTLPLACSAQTSSAQKAAIISRLKKLVDEGSFFNLESQFNFYKSKIDDKDRLYFQAHIDNAFNRNDDCIKTVNQLLQKYEPQLSDSAKASVALLQADSYFKVFQYAKAANSYNTVLTKYSKGVDSAEIADIKNSFLIRNALAPIPPQEVQIKGDETIPWKKDKLTLIEIPFKSHLISYDAIFDTRANISCATETYAKKLGLKMLNVTYEESSGATGNKFKSSMGIADSLYLGNILVKNAVFQVFPDSVLYIAPLKMQMNLIVGFPIIEQLQEVHIFNDGRLVVAATPSRSDLHNFALDGLEPVVSLNFGKDSLSFLIDLGNNATDLYLAYFNKYKDYVLQTGIKKTIQAGGAGGIIKQDVFKLPSVNLQLGQKTVTITNVPVQTKKVTSGEKFYGNLGQDFTSKFKELIFNFKYMYIKGI